MWLVACLTGRRRKLEQPKRSSTLLLVQRKRIHLDPNPIDSQVAWLDSNNNHLCLSSSIAV